MITIRRVLTQVEEIHHEFGPPAAQPLIRGAIAAVLTNPFAGRYEPDIVPMMDALQPVGIDMARRLLDAMGLAPAGIASYGKGAIVGADGELERGHGASEQRVRGTIRNRVQALADPQVRAVHGGERVADGG